MTSDRRNADKVREVRVEGLGLFVIGALVVAAVIGAFLLGRWVERRSQPTGEFSAAESHPLEQVERPETATDTAESLTFFDDLRGEGKELEPQREVTRPRVDEPPSEPRQAETAPEPSGAVDPDGAYFVQVFAGRERSSVEDQTKRLESRGYPVTVLSTREGQGALYKVRVGGYATKEEAREAARRLQKEGFAGAWVPPPE